MLRHILVALYELADSHLRSHEDRLGLYEPDGAVANSSNELTEAQSRRQQTRELEVVEVEAPSPAGLRVLILFVWTMSNSKFVIAKLSVQNPRRHFDVHE